MLIKFIIFAIMFFIIISLGISFTRLMGVREQSNRFVNTVLLRIGLSLGLVCMLLIAAYFHWLQPHWL
jgi:uncharacterized membrane protein